MLQGGSFALKFVSPRYIDKQKSSVKKTAVRSLDLHIFDGV